MSYKNDTVIHDDMSRKIFNVGNLNTLIIPSTVDNFIVRILFKRIAIVIILCDDRNSQFLLQITGESGRHYDGQPEVTAQRKGHKLDLQ